MQAFNTLHYIQTIRNCKVNFIVMLHSEYVKLALDGDSSLCDMAYFFITTQSILSQLEEDQKRKLYQSL